MNNCPSKFSDDNFIYIVCFQHLETTSEHILRIERVSFFVSLKMEQNTDFVSQNMLELLY